MNYPSFNYSENYSPSNLFDQNINQNLINRNKSTLKTQSRISSLQFNGLQTINQTQSYFNNNMQDIIHQNQQNFHEQLYDRQIRKQIIQERLKQQLGQQALVLQNLLQGNNDPELQNMIKIFKQDPFYQQQNQQQKQNTIKSITLKPLDYYTQQIYQVQYQDPSQFQQSIYQDPSMPQQFNQQIYQPPQLIDFNPQKNLFPERIHGFKNLPPQQSIEVQTDDQMTNFPVIQQEKNLSRVETYKNLQGNQTQSFLYEKPDTSKRMTQQISKLSDDSKKQQKYIQGKYKPLPPGMTSKQRGEKNLKLFKIFLQFVLFYWIEYKKSVQRKRMQALDIKGNQAVKSLQGFLLYFKEQNIKAILAFTQSKEDILVSDKRKVTEQIMEKRISNLKQQVRRLFLALLDSFNSSKVPGEHLEFFASISHNYQFLPPNFLFLFELNRLEFNTFGALHHMTKERGTMLILTFYIIRVYIYRLILRPWTDFPQVKKKESLVENCYLVASVMYELTMGYIKNRIPKVEKNQVHLAPELRATPRELGPLVLERFELPYDPAELRKLRQKEEPLILGLEDRDSLKKIFEDEKFTNEIDAYLEEWSESIYDLAHQRWMFKKQEQKKLRDLEHETFIEQLYFNQPDELKKAMDLINRIKELQNPQK